MLCASGDAWHLDKVFITIGGKTHDLWRAVDQHGIVLVISRRDATAATRLFRKLLTGLMHVPRVLVTDKLASYRNLEDEEHIDPGGACGCARASPRR